MQTDTSYSPVTPPSAPPLARDLRARLAALAVASQAISACATLPELALALDRAARTVLDAGRVAYVIPPLWFSVGPDAPPNPLTLPLYQDYLANAHEPFVIPDLADAPDLPDDLRVAARALSARACVIQPVRTGELTFGAWVLHRASPWTTDDLHLVQTLAAQAALVRQRLEAEQARLEAHDRARRQGQRLHGIQATVAALGADLALEPLLGRIVTEAARTFNVSAVAVLLWNKTQEAMVVRASIGLSGDYIERQRLPRARIFAIAGPDGRVPPVIISDLRARPFGDPALIASEGLLSAMATPMEAGHRLLGALVAYTREAPRTFTAEDLEVCALFTQYAAVALDHAQLFQATERRTHELALLHQISVATSSLELDDLLEELCDQVRSVLHTESFYIALYNAERDLLDYRILLDKGTRLPALERSAKEPSMAAWIVRHREPVLVGDWQRDRPDLPTLAGAGHMPRCYLGLPLLARDKLVGVISAQDERPDTFTPELQVLFGAIANQAAIAIENARLFEETRRRVLELSTVQMTTLQLAGTLDVAAVLDTIADAIQRMTSGAQVDVYLYQEERDTLTLGAAFHQDGKRAPLVMMPYRARFTAHVLRTRTALIVPAVTQHPLFADEDTAQWPAQALAGFPFLRAGRVLGLMSVAYTQDHDFGTDELRLLMLLADHAAIAVENARLYEDAQRRLNEVSTLYTLARQLTGTINVEAVLDTVVNALKQVLDCRACSISLLEPDGETLTIRSAVGIEDYWRQEARLRLGEGVAGRAALENRVIYVQDTYADPQFIFFDPAVHCVLCVPLNVKGRVIGALSVDSATPDAFGGLDQRLLSITAAQAAVALENAQLYSDLKERADKLAHANAELQENDRLKDELVQNISHELRTPLTFIRSYIEMLIAGDLGQLEPQQLKSLRVVASKTQTLTRLVNDIILLQQIENGTLQMEPLDLSDLAHFAVSGAASNAAERKLTLINAVPAEPCPVRGDRDRLSQVFDNLLGNALKFSPPGGQVTVRIADADTTWRVSISDTGIGIPLDQLDKIWQRFYQVDGSATRRFGGAGLGLAIVQRIVQAHGGTVSVESTVGQGSTFYFSIPKAAPESPV